VITLEFENENDEMLEVLEAALDHYAQLKYKMGDNEELSLACDLIVKIGEQKK
jgi:hypothetical protein